MTTVDRYRSFKGIDFDGQASRMIARIEFHTEGSDDPFWAYFFQRRNATEGMRYDDQLLLSAIGLPCAVHPDRQLRRVARDLDWPVVEG